MRRPLLTAAIIFAVAVIAVLILPLLWLQSELNSPYYGSPSAETFVEIPINTGTGRTADLLVRSGVLRHRLPFILYIRYKGLGGRIQAGEYRFAEPQTPIEIARKLVRGEVAFRSITIPEGLTARETIELLAAKGMGDLDAMEELLLKTEWIRDIDPVAKSLEGYLFPETYRFSRRSDAETIIKTMVDQSRKRFEKAIALHPPGSGWSLRRIVILASMIEKEVRDTKESPLVASVLVNRLDKGMPLGVDATIIYAMKLAGSYRGNLSKSDMSMESPYNSYLHPGLPPGPIANPGEASIVAALRPANTDYYYYVSRNDGTHQFSRDFAAHQNAVNRFQRNRH